MTHEDDAGKGLGERLRGRVPWRVLAAVLALGLAYWLGSLGGSPGPETAKPAAVDARPAGQTIYTCSMHPQIRMTEPGKCPICGMDLIVATDDQGSDTASGVVSLSESARARARIRTTAVRRTAPKGELKLLGRVEYDETRMRSVTPWTSGRIERLHVRVTGARVRKGQVVATLYSPEVHAAMRDLVAAVRSAERLADGAHGSAGRARETLAAAREKLKLLGVPENEVDRVASSMDPPRLVEVRSPYAGTVLQRVVEEGGQIATGAPILHVADLSRVWVQIDAYESDLPHLQVGQSAQVSLEGSREAPFLGRIAFIDPVIDEKTRTAKVRVEVDNPEGNLRPGMFAEAVIEASVDQRLPQLVIPQSAPLFSGRRSVVYVEVPGAERPTYELRVVRLGPRAGPLYPVLSGLSEGERVVIQGAFVLDADLQLQGGASMMSRGDDRDLPTAAPVPMTGELRAQLAPLMEAYLEAHKQLAADALDPAREALGAVGEAVSSVHVDHPAETADAWQSVASDLTGHARSGAVADDVAKVRIAFEHVSAAVVRLLRLFGNPIDAPVRLAHCPMAFDSRGAQWVQRDEPLENPYYGASMLRCGEFRQTALPEEPLPAGADEAAPVAPKPAANADEHQHQHHP